MHYFGTNYSVSDNSFPYFREKQNFKIKFCFLKITFSSFVDFSYNPQDSNPRETDSPGEKDSSSRVKKKLVFINKTICFLWNENRIYN